MTSKLNISTVIVSLALVSLIGCGEYGGGASLVPKVTILPADLSGDAEASDSGTTTAGTPETEGGEGPGTLVGRVVLDGAYDALPSLYVKGADIKDKEVCAAEDIPDERLVLGEGRGVKNVFVFMKKAPKGSPKPSSAEPVIFDQKNCRFLPHCMIVPVGATLKVLSGDDVAHNTHTNPARNNGVSSLVAANDREGQWELVCTSAENPFSVTCDFHSWMKAYHLPLDHPYGAVTDDNGNFEITDVPAGEHDFVVWHEAANGNFVERKLKVKVSAGQKTEIEIPYAVSKLAL